MQGLQYIASALLGAAAFYLALMGTAGWGWFLFAAVLVAGA